MTIKKLFEPNSVAVVGLSGKGEVLGYRIIENLIEADYKGKIYPVHSDLDEILGLNCYPSLKEAPKKTQLLVVTGPISSVPQILKECDENNVSNAILFSDDCFETEDERRRIRREVREIAEDQGIRILGPNSQGVNNTFNGLCASWPLVTKKGPVSIVSHSGAIGATIASWAENENIGVSKVVNLGKKTDIDETTLVEYLSDDDETGIIILYMESIENGREFLHVAEKAAENKPVVVLKGGRSEITFSAVESHLEDSPGNYEIFKSACRQAGLKLACGLEELYSVIRGLSSLPKSESKNTVVITNTGGAAVLAMDSPKYREFAFVDLPERSVERLKENLPDTCTLENPLDLNEQATAQMYDKAIKILSRYKDVDDLIVITGHPVAGISDVVKNRSDSVTILSVILSREETGIKEKRKLRENKLPVFSSPESAIRALEAL